VKCLPDNGLSEPELCSKLKEISMGDMDMFAGRMFGHAFFTGDDARRVGERAYLMHLYGNAIGPTLFPSILELEKEFVSIAAAHLGGDREVVGNFTSGGTESIMLAVKTSRDRARDRRPEFASPEMVIPLSTHAAFFKAAHFLESNLVPVEVDGDFRADVQAIKESLSNNTVMIAASAPSYAHNCFKLDFQQRKL
jgi:sphinganine-1-phosphate aldolase